MPCPKCYSVISFQRQRVKEQSKLGIKITNVLNKGPLSSCKVTKVFMASSEYFLFEVSAFP